MLNVIGVVRAAGGILEIEKTTRVKKQEAKEAGGDSDDERKTRNDQNQHPEKSLVGGFWTLWKRLACVESPILFSFFFFYLFKSFFIPQK